ncbi:MAG: ISAs1 family transposase [Bacteroidales bacterium]|jgi:predicted transposase YbfD/YdcC|nr:ISAs1 family transposase [Bacteroidales bacterium]
MAETSLHLAFKFLRDPRVERGKRHNLLDIIILSVLAVLSGAESYDSIEDFGKTNLAFLKQFLSLKNGIPSHDTINRVFQALNPDRFEKCFIAWTQGLKETGAIERVIAIDGKTLRGSKDSFHHKGALHSVNAWSVENGLCLGQLQCGEKTNEITTIPMLLDLLYIKGSVITIDAIGTQTKIAEKIIENNGDYILAVKGNQKELEEDVKLTCSLKKSLSNTSTIEKGHGRIETRQCEIFNKGYVDEKKWCSVQSVIKITATREFTDKTEIQERFYISSLPANNDFNTLIRSHWSVENNLHWTLDMIFGEDEQRKRANHAANNFAIVRKIALNLLKKDTSKGSLRTKRLKAGWSKDFLISLLKI